MEFIFIVIFNFSCDFLIYLVIFMVNSRLFEKQIDDIRERGFIDYVLEEDLMFFFIMYFVENFCWEICGYFEQKGTGRPRYPIENMLGLLLCSYCNKNTSLTVIAKNAQFNIPSMILLGV